MTNIHEEEETEYENLIATIADDPYLDGPVLGLPVVWFSTTQYQGGLPTTSSYPRFGNTGQYYKRVMVPMINFNDFKMWRCDSQSKNEVRLLLTNNRLHDTLLDDLQVFHLLDITQWNEFLMRNENGQWFTTDHADGHPLASFAVIGDFDILDGRWDRVKKEDSNSGRPLRANDPQLQNRVIFWKQRWIEAVEAKKTREDEPFNDSDCDSDSDEVYRIKPFEIERNSEIVDRVITNTIAKFVLEGLTNVLNELNIDVVKKGVEKEVVKEVEELKAERYDGREWLY